MHQPMPIQHRMDGANRGAMRQVGLFLLKVDPATHHRLNYGGPSHRHQRGEARSAPHRQHALRAEAAGDAAGSATSEEQPAHALP